MHEIESGSVSNMIDSSSAALLEEISSKSKKLQVWPWVLTASILIFILLVASNSPVWPYFLGIPLCAGGLFWAVRADQLRKTVVLFYDLEQHIEGAYQNLHNTFDSLKNCSCVWHIESRGNITTTYDWKVHAGASAVVKRRNISPHTAAPPYFKSNVSIPALSAGRQTLYFLPDRILVWDTNGVGAINYDRLNINFDQTRFIEDSSVPSDARVVDHTWRFVNKSGGPDRRFNNNRQVPICLYESILLTSNSGLQELFQTSRTGIGVQLKTAAQQMASTITEREAKKVDSSGEIYVKCPCNNCDVLIEFPEQGLGQTITCPHCGLETVLFKPAIQES